MAATSLPSLLLLLTTAQLLFGGDQAAYLQEPENPGRFQQDNPAGNVQHYELFHSSPLKESKAKYQFFENNNEYQLQNELGSPNTAQTEGLFSEAEEIAAVSSDTCADEYNTQLKKLEEIKRQYNAQLKTLEEMKRRNNAQLRNLEDMKGQYNAQLKTLEEMKKAQLKMVENMKKCCNSAGFHGCCQAKKLLPKASSGIFNLESVCGGHTEPFTSPRASCDMDTDGGGWMVIQRRVPRGTVNFYRNWQDYVKGFGDLKGEFWYGLRNIHCLTAREEVELRIDMVTTANTKIQWTYQTFKVAGAGDKYRLTIGGGKGNTRNNAMATHNGAQFSTYDQDNDNHGGGYSCAQVYKGGWWYKHCHNANLNGLNTLSSSKGLSHMVWYDGHAWQYLSSVEMKIRAKKCHG